MKNLFSKCILISLVSSLTIEEASGQFALDVSTGDVISSNNGIGLQSIGTYGSQGVLGSPAKWIRLGIPNIGNTHPQRQNLYGTIVQWNGDRAFFGMKSGTDSSSQAGVVEDTDVLIAWGNDNNEVSNGPDRLIFEYHNFNTFAVPGTTPNAMTASPREIATMLPNGNVGIGTSSPTTQLHTTGGVRFAGLPTSNQTTVVGIDANGVLSRSALTTGPTLNCALNGFIPKVDGSNSLGCSVAFDNGNGSIGMGWTNNFAYTLPTNFGMFGGPTWPPASGNLRLKVGGAAQALVYFATSDENLKEDIDDIDEPLEIINSLQGRTYFWNDVAVSEFMAEPNAMQYGLIAQEVAAVLPEAVMVDEAENYAINYNSFIPILIEGQKALYELYSTSQKQNIQLQETLQNMYSKVSSLPGDQLTQIGLGEFGMQNELYQNIPNPFTTKTTIEYYIANMKASASIIVMDLNGKELNKYPISRKGNGKVEVDASKLADGMYLYSLVVDHQEVATRKMVLSH